MGNGTSYSPAALVLLITHFFPFPLKFTTLDAPPYYPRRALLGITFFPVSVEIFFPHQNEGHFEVDTST